MGRKNRKTHFNNGSAGSQSHPPQQSSPESQLLREYYSENEHLGSESRETEFKNGPGFIKYGFRENVAKYVCSFVNSQENGKLLIGVNDSGYVVGYDCNHRLEDGLRREVDEAVKDVVPPIFPKDYRVRFVPVCNEYGHPLGNLKVIEIMVQGATIAVKDQLCCNKQGVFIRRDGSIQELKAHEIQEWMRRRYQSEMDKLRNNERNMQRQLQNKESELRQMEEKLQQKNNELERKDMSLLRQKSAMNHVSDENRQLQEQNNNLKQNSDQHGAQGGSEVIERLEKMEKMLEEQGARIDKKKSSKVCVVS